MLDNITQILYLLVKTLKAKVYTGLQTNQS